MKRGTNTSSSIGLVGFVSMTLLASMQLAGSCVDGVTPDCSDAAVCGPVGLDSGPSDSAIQESSTTQDTGQNTPQDSGASDSDAGDADADG